MLVLSRRANESIQIGDSVRIRVARISGTRVRLAIDAPAEMRVLRAELAEFQSEETDDETSGPFKCESSFSTL
jgi:carbon storage regulator